MCKMLCQLQTYFIKDPNFFFFFLLQPLFRIFYKINIAYSIFKIPKVKSSESFQNPNLKEQCSKHFLFQLCTSSRMCSLYIIMSCNSNFIFILCWLRKNIKHNCINVIVIVIVFFSKKNDPSFGLGKKLKSYATIAPLSFLLGKGGKPLYLKPYLKTLKHCKVHLLTDPYNALVRPPMCL